MSIKPHFLDKVVGKMKTATVVAACKGCVSTYLIDIELTAVAHNSWEGLSIKPKPVKCKKCDLLIKEVFFFHSGDRGGNSPGSLKNFAFVLTGKVGSLSKHGLSGTFSIKDICFKAS